MNNFDVIRLVAALSVMLAHSYGLQNSTGNVDIVSRYFHGAEYPGSMAVYAFFILSGVLITQSYENQNNVVRFVVLRFFRIWPGLCMNVVVTVLLVGAFFSKTHNLITYLLEPGPIQYLLTNIGHIGGVEGFIPGAFPKTITPNGVNFPLWTLPVEVQCYAMVVVIGSLGLYRNPSLLAVTIAILSSLYLLVASTEPSWPFPVYFFHKFSTYSFYPVVFFMAGIVLYNFRSLVQLRWELFVLSILIYLFSRGSWLEFPLLYVSFAYGIIFISGLSILRSLRPKYDYSYGIYIYGFVCQQIVANRWPSMSNYAGLSLSVPLAFAFAAASWHCIERPSIAFSRRMTKSWEPIGGRPNLEQSPSVGRSRPSSAEVANSDPM